MNLLISNPKRTQETNGAASDWLTEANYIADRTTDIDFVIDISRVETISSDQLSELLRLHAKLRRKGRMLVLDNVQEQIWQVFLVTRLDRLIEIREPDPL